MPGLKISIKSNVSCINSSTKYMLKAALFTLKFQGYYHSDTSTKDSIKDFIILNLAYF